MTRRLRMVVFALGATGLAALLVAACLRLPRFGGAFHPYGQRAVHAALARRTSNVVASVTFDQRAFDTLGEESILFGAVLGTVVLLRQTREEHQARPRPVGVARSVRRYALITLPVALLVGLYVVAHGQISPGGGFQGGVVAATALHLLYVGVDYRALERIRPVGRYETADAAGEGAYLVIGVAGLLAGSAFLANVLPFGTFRSIPSGGTVPLLNAAIGMEVAAAVVALLARFLDQALEIGDGTGPPGTGATRAHRAGREQGTRDDAGEAGG